MTMSTICSGFARLVKYDSLKRLSMLANRLDSEEQPIRTPNAKSHRHQLEAESKNYVAATR
jgi:hypothetical protein